MDITELFDIFARYIDFSIDFLSFNGMERYSQSNSINPDLTAFFIFGLTIAYLIARATKVPGYESIIRKSSSASDIAQAEAKKNNQDNSDLILFAVMSVGGALIFHLVVAATQSIGQNMQLGSIKDTINAVLAYNAVYYPLNSLAMRLFHREGLPAFIPLIRRRSVALGCFALLFLLIVAFYGGSLIYLVYAFISVHGIEVGSVIVPVAILALIGLILGISLRDRRSAPETQVSGSSDDTSASDDAVDTIQPSD